MKEQDIKDTAKNLRDIIAESQKLTSSSDFHTVFLYAETIISSLSYLISPIADMEQKYRQLIVVNMEDGKSHAAAETYAKASEQYKEWRKYAALYELGHEQIMLLKKFRDDLQLELSRT